MTLQRVDMDLTEVEIDGEIAVYHPGRDAVVLLNSSASEIWRRTPITSIDALAEDLADLFGIPIEEASSGVRAGVALLLAEALLVEGGQDR